MTDRAAGKSRAASAHVVTFTRGTASAREAGGTRTLVTLDKDEMRGYDWLFSDFTECETFQLETMTRCLVTAISLFPTTPLLSPVSLV